MYNNIGDKNQQLVYKKLQALLQEKNFLGMNITPLK